MDYVTSIQSEIQSQRESRKAFPMFLQKISLLQLGATDAWSKHIFHWFS